MMREATPPDEAEAGAAGAEETLTGATRRCIVTGDLLPRRALLRFVVGPDGKVWPDLEEKLPGRGLWVRGDAQSLATAIRKNAFAKAARGTAVAAPDLVERVETLLRQRFIQLLGLAKRAGCIIAGFSQVEPAVQRGQIALLLIATDAGQDGRSKLCSKLLPEQCVTLLSSTVLGQALGYDQLVYVGIMPHALTAALRGAAARFSAYSVNSMQETIAPPAPLAQIGAETGMGCINREGNRKQEAAMPPLPPVKD